MAFLYQKFRQSVENAIHYAVEGSTGANKFVKGRNGNGIQFSSLELSTLVQRILFVSVEKPFGRHRVHRASFNVNRQPVRERKLRIERGHSSQQDTSIIPAVMHTALQGGKVARIPRLKLISSDSFGGHSMSAKNVTLLSRDERAQVPVNSMG